MKNIKIEVTIPYSVEFRRHHHRRIEGDIIWDDGNVAICTVTAQEAPVAYRIAPGDGSVYPAFDIRSFDGKLWWPLFDTPVPLSVMNYIDSATGHDAHLLSMMNLSPATLDSPRWRTTALFENDASIRDIQSSSWGERWLLAHRAACCTLFCDDVVYLEGGQPAYFGILRGADGDPALSLEIGSLQPPTVGIPARWLPGPRRNRRQDAACRSHVFRIEDIEDVVCTLEQQGFRPHFSARATVCMDVELKFDPSEVSVDALTRRALERIGPETARWLRKAMDDKPLPITNGIIHRSVCRDALQKLLLGRPPELIRTKFGFEFEWVEKALKRLDARFPPSLSAEEEAAFLSYFLPPETLRVGRSARSTTKD